MEFVGTVAQLGEPWCKADNAIELVTMKHEIAFALGAGVNGLVQHGDLAETQIDEIAEVFIVIAGNVEDLGSLAGLAQQFLDDVVVALEPVPGLAQRPGVHNVAHKIEIFRIRGFEEFDEGLRLRTTGAQVNVGHKNCAVAAGDVRSVEHVFNPVLVPPSLIFMKAS